MSTDTTVDHEELKRHLEAVYGVSWKVHNAAAAAHQVGVGGWGQYGVLSLLFLPTILHVGQETDHLVTTTADLMETCADAVGSVRDSYADLEAAASQLLKELE